jgi:hypothetical protein
MQPRSRRPWLKGKKFDDEASVRWRDLQVERSELLKDVEEREHTVATCANAVIGLGRAPLWSEAAADAGELRPGEVEKA